MTYKEAIHAGTAKQIALSKQLAPANIDVAQKNSKLAQIRAAVVATADTLDLAIQRNASAQSLVMIGAPGGHDADEAKTALATAQKAHRTALQAAEGARTLEQELIGHRAAVSTYAANLAAIEADIQAAKKDYLRELCNDAGGRWRATGELLASIGAELLGLHQALALAGHDPTILSPGFWQFQVPSLELPAAKTQSGGPLFDIDTAKAGQSAALAAIRARIVADDVHIHGLT